jgi:peptide/nickel transport system permease protein
MNPQVSAQAREKLDRLYGLDRPLAAQYRDWFWRMVRFDFGDSLVDGEGVVTKILKTVPVTLALNILTLVLTIGLGVPIGVWLAVRQGGPVERAADAALLGALSLPGFWLALLLMAFAGVRLHWLPVSGLHCLFYEDFPVFRRALDLLWHLVLPVFVPSLAGCAVFSRYVKESVLATLQKNYVRAARARGLSEKAVLFRHALRNALLPLVTLLGLSVPSLLGGSVVLESVFSIPGMGRLFFNAVSARDYPVIMGVLVLGAALTLLGNALADAAYAAADPRIRRGGVHR